MENEKEKGVKKLTNSMKWVIFVSIFVVILAGSSLAAVIINLNKTTTTSSNIQNEEKKENTIIEEATLEELANMNNQIENEEEENKNTDKNNTTTKKNSTKPVVQTPNKYYIKVNYGAQVVTIYTYDKDGKYTVPVKAMICSTGALTPKSGVYKVQAKIRWCKMYGNCYAQYCSQVYGDILFHSVPYAQKSNDTLEYWLYDRLGSKDSMGCIRLTTKDAKWLYENCKSGTKIEFYSSSNPGPLGKPTAQKLSNAPANLKNWDPTDPDPKNPWRNYKPETNKNEQTNSTTNSQNTNNNQTTNNTTNNVNNNQNANTSNNVNNEVGGANNNQEENNTTTNETTNNTITNTEKPSTPSNNEQNNNQTINNTNDQTNSGSTNNQEKNNSEITKPDDTNKPNANNEEQNNSNNT